MKISGSILIITRLYTAVQSLNSSINLQFNATLAVALESREKKKCFQSALFMAFRSNIILTRSFWPEADKQT